MTAIPQLVAIFNGFGGGASALVAIYEILYPKESVISIFVLAAIAFSTILGSLTLTGSFIAFGKLQEIIPTRPILFPLRNYLNSFLLLLILFFAIIMIIPNFSSLNILYILIALSLLAGILIVIPIGGADMPVIIALLNSYSGIAGAGAGFVLNNPVLIISGSLVGASGLILTRIMIKAMNRSLANVILGGLGSDDGSQQEINENRLVKSLNTEDAAMILGYAENVIFVPGYCLAVAQAQHQINELANILKNNALNKIKL